MSGGAPKKRAISQAPRPALAFLLGVEGVIGILFIVTLHTRKENEQDAVKGS